MDLASSDFAVDVQDEGNLIRRGIICDVIHNKGLTVNFDHPGHHADFIPWEKCIQPIETDYSLGIGDNAHTLFRWSPDEPWCWYPSTILAGCAPVFAFVDIEVHGERYQEVVAWERLRAMTPYETLSPNAFVKCEVTLPDGFPIYVDTAKRMEFLKMWDLATKTKGIEIYGNRLSYIATRGKSVRDLSLPFFHMTRELAISDSMKKLFARRENTHRNDSTHRVTQDNTEESEISTRTPCVNAVLPLDVLYGIFMFLDADNQFNCRHVCRIWDSLLTSPSMSIRVKIDLGRYGTSCQKLATMLHKMVTHSTKTLVLTSDHCAQTSLEKSNTLTNSTKVIKPPLAKLQIRTIHAMLKAKGVKIPTIVISGATVYLGDFLKDIVIKNGMLPKKPKWQEICDNLVLEDVTVCCPFLKSSICLITKEVIDLSDGDNAEGALKKWYPEDGHCTLCKEWTRDL